MLPKDPIILLSFVNTKLRDLYPSLDAFCDGEQVSKQALEQTLAAIDYMYDPDKNAFV